MSAFGELRTSREAETKRIRQLMTHSGHQPRQLAQPEPWKQAVEAVGIIAL
jgi:hypothetical protein